jgi:hypothetical protein
MLLSRTRTKDEDDDDENTKKTGQQGGRGNPSCPANLFFLALLRKKEGRNDKQSKTESSAQSLYQPRS